MKSIPDITQFQILLPYPWEAIDQKFSIFLFDRYFVSVKPRSEEEFTVYCEVKPDFTQWGPKEMFGKFNGNMTWGEIERKIENIFKLYWDERVNKFHDVKSVREVGSPR